MADAKVVKNLLKNPSIAVSETSLSYVKCLMPHSELDRIIFVHRKMPTADRSKTDKIEISYESTDISGLDTTGSPLECSFGNDCFEESIIESKRNWTKEEEFHLPLNRLEACMSLNLCLEYLEKDWLLPVLAVCDGKDSEQTVLLGAHMRGNWLTTIHARTQGLQQLSKIENSLPLLLENHVKLASVQEHEVSVTASSVYELFTMREGFTECKNVSVNGFEGSVCIEVHWDTLSFYAPVRASTSNLVLEVAAGWNDSPLKGLWEQLMLINQYLILLEGYQQKHKSTRYSVMPLQFPNSFSPLNLKYHEEITDKLNMLLSGDSMLGETQEDGDKQTQFPLEQENIEDDIKLREYADNVKSRHNMDFTDLLWQLLTGSADYAQVTDCIHTVFEEILAGNAKPQINSTNSTRLAKIMLELIHQKATAPILAGSLPLELLVDAGLEKLSRDYTYLLLSANLIDLHDVQQKMCNVSAGPFKVEDYWKKLTLLSQIHVCLEFLLLTQNYLDCSTVNLQSIFNYAFRKYLSEKSPIKSFPHLLENRVHFLKAPLSSIIVEQIIKGSPASCRLTFSSVSRTSKMVTTSHYSRISIFPPNIYSFDDANEKEEVYYVTTLISSSNKVN